MRMGFPPPGMEAYGEEVVELQGGRGALGTANVASLGRDYGVRRVPCFVGTTTASAFYSGHAGVSRLRSGAGDRWNCRHRLLSDLLLKERAPWRSLVAAHGKHLFFPLVWQPWFAPLMRERVMCSAALETGGVVLAAYMAPLRPLHKTSTWVRTLRRDGVSTSSRAMMAGLCGVDHSSNGYNGLQTSLV